MTTHQLDWDNLRIFLAVARGQSALEAASRLEMSHSTVTPGCTGSKPRSALGYLTAPPTAI